MESPSPAPSRKRKLPASDPMRRRMSNSVVHTTHVCLKCMRDSIKAWVAERKYLTMPFEFNYLQDSDHSTKCRNCFEAGKTCAEVRFTPFLWVFLLLIPQFPVLMTQHRYELESIVYWTMQLWYNDKRYTNDEK